jgi:hypothetical protein
MYKKLPIVFLLLISMAVRAQQSTGESDLAIYLLIGQSNMAGRGAVTGKYATEGDPRVLMFNQENKWVPARHPLHFDKPKLAGVGPGLSFGIAMAGATPDHKIGLLPCAVGGTSINKWTEGAYDSATRTHPYDDMVIRVREAMKYGTVKGVIWLQGESDAKDRSAVYLGKLKALIEKIRLLVNDPKLPFVAGELGTYQPEYALINAELAKLPAEVPFTRVAGSAGFVDKGDGVHFDSPSADAYGVSFAEQMKQLQKAQANK